ncbi:MAG: T9SS type A sorting domain-containing protein [bacterium]
MLRTSAFATCIVAIASTSLAAEFDYTNQPRLVGRAGFPGPTPGRCIARSGDLLLTISQSAGLIVLDAADPASMTLLSTEPSLYRLGARVAASATHAYVTQGAEGVAVVDITDPSNPVVGPSFVTTDAQDIAVSGDRLIVADGAGGFVIATLADPGAPAILRTFAMGGADRVVVRNGLAYGLNYSQLLVIDPHASPPTIAGSYVSPLTTAGLFVADGLAYIGGGVVAANAYDPFVEVVDVSNPAAIANVATLPLATAGGTLPPNVPCIWGDDAGTRMAVSSGPSNEFFLYTIDSPTVATPIGSVGYRFGHFLREGDLLFTTALANGISGTGEGCGAAVSVFDVSHPYSVQPLGILPAPALGAVRVEGSRAYAASGNDVHVVDLSDPAAPSIAGTWTAAAAIGGVAAIGDLVCASWGLSWMSSVVDLTDPSQPDVLWSDATTTSNGLLAGAGTAFVISSSSAFAFTVLDVSDPQSIQTDVVNLSFQPSDVEVFDGVSYALGAGGQLLAASAEAPSTVYYQTTVAGYADALVTDGSLLLVVTSPSGGNSTIEIYGVDHSAPPLPPTFLGRIVTCGTATSLSLRNGILYASKIEPGIDIYDLSDPMNPFLVSSFATDDWGFVGAGANCVAIKEGGLLTTLPLHSSTPVAVPAVAGPAVGSLRVWPNPGRGDDGALIRYTMPAPGRAELRIVDVRGRTVDRVVSGWRAAGEHQASWPAGLATGIYFVQLRTPAGVESAKVTRIR